VATYDAPGGIIAEPPGLALVIWVKKATTPLTVIVIEALPPLLTLIITAIGFPVVL